MVNDAIFLGYRAGDVRFGPALAGSAWPDRGDSGRSDKIRSEPYLLIYEESGDKKWGGGANSILKRVEQILFYFLFFAIPFQVRKVLYSSGWYFNEWQSVSIYATDLLLLALFAFWLANSHKSFSYYVSSIKYHGINLRTLIRNTKYLIQKPDFYLVLFLVAAAISVKNSSDFYVGAFLWLKLLEFSLFYFYLKNYAIKKFGFINILYVLVLGGVFQAVVAIGQFLRQGDLGLRWLGESVLGPHMTGVASFFIDSGEKVMRAYGTTPHPNILAAYLFLAIFAFYFLWLYRKPNKQNSNSQYDIMIYHTIWIYVGLAVYVLLLLGLFFTFSRTVIFLWAAGFVVRAALIGTKSWFRQKFWQNPVFKTRLLQILVATILVVAVFFALYWPEVSSRMTLSSEEEAVRLRVFYNKESLGGGLNLFGIGLGDFTPWLMEQNPNLPRYVYQPVHNIYLLLYSEVGIIGLVFFLLFLAFLIKDFITRTKLEKLYHNSFLLVTLSILFIGLFDHFLLTIQQGRFVFWLGLALLAPSLNKHSSENDPK